MELQVVGCYRGQVLLLYLRYTIAEMGHFSGLQYNSAEVRSVHLCSLRIERSPAALVAQRCVL